MTIRRAVKGYASDHPEVVENALKGERMAVDRMARDVINYMHLRPTDEIFEAVEDEVFDVLVKIENGEIPLWGEWRGKSVEDIEFYINYCKEELEDTDNPVYSKALDNQWDEAYFQWVVKGGNLMHETPLNPEKQEEGGGKL